MKMRIFICLFSIISTISFAQSENKDVIIIASGDAKTVEEAKQSALRNATEQAFRFFVSSKTEIFNDLVAADQMSSVSSGNIKSYKILNLDQLPDGRYGVTIKAIISVEKFTNFVQAKGIKIEVKGGTFALNVKQQLLNEFGEIKAVADMIGLLHEPMQISFDYLISNGNPKSMDSESENWAIPLVVSAKCNKNIVFCANYFKKTIEALSLSPYEIETYKSLNKQVYPVTIKYAGKIHVFYLRKQASIYAINSLAQNWEFYLRLFSVKSGIERSLGNGKWQIHSFIGENSISDNNEAITVSFPNVGQLACTFTWSDIRTLIQIEQMTDYSVEPKGIVFNYKNGGYVVYEKDGHGLVVAPYDIGYLNWTNAKNICDELSLNGYSDWFLPSKDEFEVLHKNIHKKGFIIFKRNDYWSRTEYASSYAWYFNFFTGIAYYGDGLKDDKHFVRAVRKF